VDEPVELLHVPIAAARSGGHKVIGQKLLFVHFAVGLVELILEVQQHVGVGFAHEFQHLGGHVLGRDLQLAGDVVGSQAFGVAAARFLIEDYHVVAYARSNEHPFHAGYRPQPLEQGDLPAVVQRQRGTGPRPKAFPVFAGALFQLFRTFDTVHVRRRAADVVDDAVETRPSSDALGLADQGVLATGDDRPALMDGDGTEGAFTVAAAVAGERVLNGVQGLNDAVLGIVRMDGVLVIQFVNAVQFRLGQQPGRRVLNQQAVAMSLVKAFGCQGIAVLVEETEGAAELAGIVGTVFEGRHLKIACRGLMIGIAESADTVPVPPVPQTGGQLQIGQFRHAVGDSVCLGIEQHAPADLVRPVVVMRYPPETRLDAAENNQFSFAVAANKVRVGDAGPVRPPIVKTAGSKVVVFPELTGGGIIGHHRVYAAGTDRPEQFRLTQPGDVGVALQVRLTDDADAETVGDQPMSDDRTAVIGIVEVGVPRNKNDVQALPASFFHLRGGRRYEHDAPVTLSDLKSSVTAINIIHG